MCSQDHQKPLPPAPANSAANRRRFWSSSEYLATIVGGLAIIVIGIWADPRVTVGAVSVLVSAYVLSRSLWKKNRNLYHAGLTTSEFLVTCVATVFITISRFALKLPAGWCVAYIALVLVVYVLGRGFAKHVGDARGSGRGLVKTI